MDITQALLLAIVQGLTEFLPISSSGHLILVPVLLGWEDQGLAFDVAVHIGTLLAVMTYFRREITLIVKDTFGSIIGGERTQYSRLGWQVIFTTIPVGLVGLFLGDWIESSMRDPKWVALAMLIFAPLLWWVDKHNLRQRDIKSLNWRDIVFIGFAQAIALLPGVSRSGMTITAALMLGLSRDAAARFSFLLAIPVIILAGGFKMLELVQSDLSIDWGLLLLGVSVSAVVAFACIHWFLGFVRRFSMLPFSLYLLALGLLILLMNA